VQQFSTFERPLLKVHSAVKEIGTAQRARGTPTKNAAASSGISTNEARVTGCSIKEPAKPIASAIAIDMRAFVARDEAKVFVNADTVLRADGGMSVTAFAEKLKMTRAAGAFLGAVLMSVAVFFVNLLATWSPFPLSLWRTHVVAVKYVSEAIAFLPIALLLGVLMDENLEESTHCGAASYDRGAR
jgi:hypothetical protein